ncbi:MAG: arginine transporter [Marinibacterium sp.]|nr:arginine transporter [Marinibacterium sp.]
MVRKRGKAGLWLLGLGLAVVLVTPLDASSTIQRACMGSDRRAANAQLCACIQGVADQILTGRDQRIAARFFTDPQAAQDTRQSDRDRDEAFWTRYRAFGDAARRVCG